VLRTTLRFTSTIAAKGAAANALQTKAGNPARVTRTVRANQHSIHAPPDKTARKPNRVSYI
jgi:hypothetical protein